jgi:predicted transcriptional regulator
MTEEQQFRAVLGFLGRMAGEVSGRIALDPELDDRLRLLAEGSYSRSQNEQDAILAEIATDSEALGHLAELLRR